MWLAATRFYSSSRLLPGLPSSSSTFPVCFAGSSLGLCPVSECWHPSVLISILNPLGHPILVYGFKCPNLSHYLAYLLSSTLGYPTACLAFTKMSYQASEIEPVQNQALHFSLHQNLLKSPLSLSNKWQEILLKCYFSQNPSYSFPTDNKTQKFLTWLAVLNKWLLTIFYYSVHPSSHSSLTDLPADSRMYQKNLFQGLCTQCMFWLVAQPWPRLYHCLQPFAQLSALWGCLWPAYLKLSILLPCFSPRT